MQTHDFVPGLHINCVEFSQPSSCLDEAMQTQKKCSDYCLNPSSKPSLPARFSHEDIQLFCLIDYFADQIKSGTLLYVRQFYLNT